MGARISAGMEAVRSCGKAAGTSGQASKTAGGRLSSGNAITAGPGRTVWRAAQPCNAIESVKPRARHPILIDAVILFLHGGKGFAGGARVGASAGGVALHPGTISGLMRGQGAV